MLARHYPELLEHNNKSIAKEMMQVGYALGKITGTSSVDDYLRLTGGMSDGTLGKHVQAIWRQAKDLSPALAPFAHYRQKKWVDPDETAARAS